ncbi:protein LBH-like [Scyliorhinus canicula]|uniref:protein LBH-like n=1 Tax=Scyliorhinus canicula TaxID=7830 RepID=UPI0018F5BDAE|nr:protein LBH-like [Scyliorhinus canicula]XP_038654830.1 protein LBH-like [Scyliorhinus canicula]XP_038654831.1 protein LBH-like [Scyliorhinus canicula]
MTGVVNSGSIDQMELSSRKDTLCFQIFPDPSDFDHFCRLKDRLPSIVVEPSEGEVESGELRWPPEEMVVTEEVSAEASKESETLVSMEQ